MDLYEELTSTQPGMVIGEQGIPELQRLTFINILRDINIHTGQRPSVHKADFLPGQYEEFRKSGMLKKRKG